jgi:hypothetical protein
MGKSSLEYKIGTLKTMFSIKKLPFDSKIVCIIGTGEKNLSLGVLTVKTNRDQDQDFSICQDHLLKESRFFSTVKTSFFLSWSRFLKSWLFARDFAVAVSRFLSRLLRLSRQIKIFEIYLAISTLLTLFEGIQTKKS